MTAVVLERQIGPLEDEQVEADLLEAAQAAPEEIVTDEAAVCADGLALVNVNRGIRHEQPEIPGLPQTVTAHMGFIALQRRMPVFI